MQGVTDTAVVPPSRSKMNKIPQTLRKEGAPSPPWRRLTPVSEEDEADTLFLRTVAWPGLGVCTVSGAGPHLSL